MSNLSSSPAGRARDRDSRRNRRHAASGRRAGIARLPHGAAIVAFAAFALALTLSTRPARAEGSAFGRAGAFAPREEDPRAVALGGAYVALAGEGGATFANPAALAVIAEPSLEAMYCNPFGLSFVRERYLSVAWRRIDDVWHVDAEGARRSVSVSRSGIGAAIYATSVDLDPEDYSETSICLSYGSQRWHDVAWGVTLRYLRASSDFEEVEGSGYALDAGLLWILPGGLRLGARMENAVGTFSWDFGSDESLAQRLELGVARPLGGRLLLASQFTLGDEETSLQSGGIGLEYSVVRGTLDLRAGLRRSNRGSFWENTPRAGVGLRWRRMELDYSVSDEGSFLDETHRLAVTLGL